MSELKTRYIDDTYVEYYNSGKHELAQIYLKSEADKVIAELKADYKEACDRLQTANLIKDEQLAKARHQKFKRCLAMAEWCEERDHYLNSLENYQLTDKEYQQVISGYWDRWYKRWLKLAEKFKEAK